MEDSFYYILFSIILISVLVSWIKSERLINPVSIYVLWWGGFIFLSTFKLIGMRLPSERTYNLLMLSVAMFAVGSISFLKSPPVLKSPLESAKNYTLDKKLRIFFYFQIVCTLILLFFLTKSINALKTMSVDVYRTVLFTEFSIFGSFKIFITYIIEPCLYISALISIAGVLLYKFPKSLLFLSFFNIILNSGVTLGRAPIFIIAVCLILSLLFAYSENKIKLKVKYILGMFIPILFILWLSMFRRNTFDFKAILLLRNYFVWYLTGPFTAYELFVDNFKVTYDWDYSYIRSISAGIEEVFTPLTRKMFNGYVPINDNLHEITKVFRSLGGKAIAHNSHYTMLYEFTRDAGIYGVIFFSYFLGIVNSVLYNNFRNKMNIYTFSMMIILLYLSLIGITRWELRYTWSCLTIIGLFFVAHKFVMYKKYKVK